MTNETNDNEGVHVAAECYVADYGPEGAIKHLRARLPAEDREEQQRVLESLGHIRKRYDLREVEA